MIEIFRLYKRLLAVIPKAASRFLNFYSLLLGILATIDSIALAGLAIVVTPLVTNSALEVPFIGEVQGASLIYLLVALSALIILKSFIAVFLLWWATRKFSQYEVLIGNSLFNSYLNSPWVHRLTKNSSDIVRIADSGISNSIAGFLLPIATLLGEALTFITILIVLFIVHPIVATTAFLYLGLIAFFMFAVLSRHSKTAAKVGFQYSLKVARLLTEMVGALKEVTLSGKVDEIGGVVRADRVVASKARANAQFLAGAPRYVLEAAVIGGFVLVGIVGFLLGGQVQAFSAIAMFSVAGFRMVPSLTRFQTILTSTTILSPVVKALVDDIVEGESLIQETSVKNESTTLEKVQRIRFENVTFRYPNTDIDAISDISLSIPLRGKIAFVGASGSGKTTMIDLILGLIAPRSGVISIDGINLSNARSSWQKLIGYIPQEVALFDSTVANNVALSWGGTFIDKERVEESLKKAQLFDFIQSKPEGIFSNVGERGLALSGGQRQRLGIARALYNDPSVLIMDEGTSALDTKTEDDLSKSLSALSEQMTLIVVAHRLSTIRDADLIFLMSEGKVLGQGTFEELVSNFPDFAEQARLSGIH